MIYVYPYCSIRECNIPCKKNSQKGYVTTDIKTRQYPHKLIFKPKSWTNSAFSTQAITTGHQFELNDINILRSLERNFLKPYSFT